MIKYIDVPVNGHDKVRVEIAPARSTTGLEELGVDLAASGELEELGIEETAGEVTRTMAAVATKAFDKMTDTISAVAHSLQTGVKSAKPAEWSVEFNISLSADAGVVIVRAGTEASFTVTLTWKSGQEA
jgi:Trypsin-co-occurring domain 1